MVTIDERFWYFVLGSVLGYFAHVLQVRFSRRPKEDRVRNEDGFTRFPLVADIALLSVIVVTVWAAFASARATNELEFTQTRLERISVCNQQFLSGTIDALNKNTTYTTKRAEKNVELQRAQSAFLRVFFTEPPSTEQQRADSLKLYFEKLNNFLKVSDQARVKVKNNPYPTADGLVACLGDNAKEIKNG